MRPVIGAIVLPAIMDVSAPATSLADRPRRAIWVTSAGRRREDGFSISSHPLADLGGVGSQLCHWVSAHSARCSGASDDRLSEPAHFEASAPRQNAPGDAAAKLTAAP